MKERERVFELVKQGIISTEEALVLLENMATEKDETNISRDAMDVKNNVRATPTPSADEHDEEEEKKAKEALDQILDELATEANHASAELDKTNRELAEINAKIKEKKEQIMVLNTMEELESIDEARMEERAVLEKEVADLQLNVIELEVEQESLEEKLKVIRKEQKEETRNQWKSSFEIPEDWKEEASESFSQFSEKMGEAGNQLGSFMKKTIRSVTDTVNDNVDWKDVNIKVPGLVSSSFDHEFYYTNCSATILDVKLANGLVEFKTWDSDDLKVEAKIKLYGKMEADTPLEAFLERSDIDVSDEKISFQIPNKRIRIEMVFYLPNRVYDHVSIKLLNGNMKVNGVEAKDIYTKNTNGDMVFEKSKATMIELEGVNGDVKIVDCSVMDLLADSVNGNFVLQSNIDNSTISNVNGDIRISARAEGLHKIDAKVVNGTLKVALPKEIGVDGTIKTSLGSIKNRMVDYEIIREKKDKTNQLLQFRRFNDEQTAHIQLSTTTGSIFLKDVE